ncbi:GDSL-type esterase/lipase family protein [Chitinophaga arvensicola]|uniref:Lysophospholipase L1 n=1 Tax=Chitinophaga arvensicola TaxID=29529 RepID=A0A1I0RV91_9BACT|nr:GDSL-type esterase/lipase family protein [Chitinophaga arvensicola]SEW45266.1 Lysophospholipase L1 [Chitinophaga arvensicola]
MKTSNYLFALLAAACLLASCTKARLKEDISPLAADKALSTATLNLTAIPGAPGDPNIKYFGRWNFGDTSQYTNYWGGGYLRVKFTGTTIKMKVGHPTHYFAKIDNGPWVSYLNASGTINLTPTPLSSGTHTISVAQGKDYDYLFNFQGFILDAGATTSAPSAATDLIEWIGDSITAGYTDAQANVSGYPWVCSELLGTEHTQIAYPGITLVSGYANEGSMEVQYFKQRNSSQANSPDWDFTRYTPKIIVINLGTNDNGKQVPDAQFQSSYIAFLANIRNKFPNAEIFVMRTFINVKTTPTLAAVNARIAAGDNKLHYINTDGWMTNADYTDGLHPSVSGNIKAANLLKPILEPYLTGVPASAVTFYQDVNYGGAASQPIPVGNYTLSQMAAKGIPNDWASSVKVPAGRTLIMYADDNFSGTSWTRTSDTPNFTTLSPNANDQVSSIKVQ